MGIGPLRRDACTNRRDLIKISLTRDETSFDIRRRISSLCSSPRPVVAAHQFSLQRIRQAKVGCKRHCGFSHQRMRKCAILLLC